MSWDYWPTHTPDVPLNVNVKPFLHSLTHTFTHHYIHTTCDHHHTQWNRSGTTGTTTTTTALFFTLSPVIIFGAVEKSPGPIEDVSESHSKKGKILRFWPPLNLSLKKMKLAISKTFIAFFIFNISPLYYLENVCVRTVYNSHSATCNKANCYTDFYIITI